MKILLAAALVAASAAHAQSPVTWKLATGYRAESFHTGTTSAMVGSDVGWSGSKAAR